MKAKARKVLPAMIAALGALSLAWAAYKMLKEDHSHDTDSTSHEDRAKKRPSSEKPRPEHSKRPKTESNGTKGAVTDISALMAAKTSIPGSDQSNPEKLGQHYHAMAAKFAQEGLNVKAVDDAKKYYRVEGQKAQPMVYMNFETPLARGAVRLGVFRIIEQEADDLPDLLFQGTNEIGRTFPAGCIVHFNRKEHYHLTVQMISHPSNPRPDSGTPGGGLNLTEALTIIPAPLPSTLQKETSTYKRLASSCEQPELKVHSIIFSNSGTLLLLLTDTSGKVYELRRMLAQAFPGVAIPPEQDLAMLLAATGIAGDIDCKGAVENQPSILHVTLARLLSANQLDQGQRDKIVAACRVLTEKLKGKVFKPKALWHVQENIFTFIDDHSSLRCPFGTSS